MQDRSSNITEYLGCEIRSWQDGASRYWLVEVKNPQGKVLIDKAANEWICQSEAEEHGQKLAIEHVCGLDQRAAAGAA